MPVFNPDISSQILFKDATEDWSKFRLNKTWHIYMSCATYILALNTEVESAFANSALAILAGIHLIVCLCSMAHYMCEAAISPDNPY